MTKETDLFDIPHISEPLKVWEKIELYTGDDPDKGVYLSRIEGFQDDDIVIASPDFITGKTLLRNNSEILVWVTKKDAVYQFASIISSGQNGSSKKYILSKPKQIQRIQRREFVRVKYSVPVSYALINQQSSKDSLTWHNSLIHDLSGSGMLLETIPDVSEGRYLLIKSHIFATIGIKDPLAACCIRTESINKGHFSGITFIRTDAPGKHTLPSANLTGTKDNFGFLMQERLVSFVFHHQVELRKKGME